jgi:Trm5-related predicted tRNA methylase
MYFKRHVVFRSRREYSKRTFKVLRAAEEPETTYKNIQDWLELDEEDSSFSWLPLLH